jgi:hypothetical protein
MRTNTIPEKVFDHESHAFKYTVGIHDKLMKKLDLYHDLGHGLNELFSEFCCVLDETPLYHQMELSVADAIIKINLEISILNPIQDGVPVYNCTEHMLTFGVRDFLTAEEIDNGCLAYNPAEGF